MASTTALVSATTTIADTAFDAFGGFTSTGIYVVTIAVFGWALLKSLSYFRDNEARDAEVTDSLDKKIYTQAIIPLYVALENLLMGQVPEDTAMSITELTEEKIRILRTNDYSFVNGAVDFGVAVDQLRRVKDKQSRLQRMRRTNRNLLIWVVGTSFLALVSATAYVIARVLPAFAYFKTYFLGGWALLFVVALIMSGIFYLISLKIDSLQHESK